MGSRMSLGNINHVDDNSGAQVVIEELHHMVHEGFLYHSSGKVTGMVDTNVDDFLFVTAANNYPHLQSLTFSFGAGDIDLLVYEGSTASADGTPEIIFNTNRNSVLTPNMVFNSAPTITGVGTLVHTGWAVPTAAGVGHTESGITTEGTGEEWLLKPSTKYLVRITNNSGATINYRWELLFYEIGY
jgi:hypothetical protein